MWHAVDDMSVVVSCSAKASRPCSRLQNECVALSLQS